jgi:transposase
MQDLEFFSRALGLEEPWRVADVEMELEAGRVVIVVECRCGTTWADESGALPVHGYEQRLWRHLDTMQFETFIRARVPRVRYADGHTEMVRVPWAQERSRWSLLFESFALRVLQNARSVSRGCELLRLDWSSAQRIMERGVERGLERRRLEGLRHVGMDEKSFRKGQDYISTLVELDPEAPRVLEVVEGRDTEAAVTLLETLPPEARGSIEAAAIDMSAAYAAALARVLPEAAVVHDRFHVSKLLGEAVDKVRRGENASLLSKGDASLKGTRYLWLYHPGELSEPRFAELEELLELRHLQTARAYYHRIRFMDFWSQDSIEAGQRFFTRWWHETQRSGLAAIKKVAATLRAHLAGLLTYFRHRITNAMSEAFNSTIQSVKASARGFRNFEHYRIRILFFLGRLDLQPR